MAIQWMDNFRAYGTDGAVLNGTQWADIGTATDPDSNAPAGSICAIMRSYSSGADSGGKFNLPTPGTHIGMAFRIWLSSFDQLPGFSFRNTGNGGLYEFYVGANGSVYVNTDQGLLADTVAPILTLNSWIHLEVRINTVTGEVAFWREGIPVSALTVTDPSPINQSVGILAFSNTSPGGATFDTGCRMKDFVAYDGATQIGPVSVLTLRPSADVSSGWTKSSGTVDYSLINEDGPPDDLGYIQAPYPPPAASIMQLENLPADIVAIRALQTQVRAAKSDGGDGNVQVSLISNGVLDDGANRPISTTFSYYTDVSETDPNTAAAWTPTAVNSAQIKINRTL